MYKITITSRGKYNNWALGTRYCLKSKKFAEICAMAIINECNFEISKFTRIGGFFDFEYYWSNDISDKIWNKIVKEVEKRKER